MTDTTMNPTLPSTTNPAPVSWFEVHTNDVSRAQRFYGAVFGWTFDDSVPGYSMIGLGDDAPIGGGIAHGDGTRPTDAVFNVQVPDVDAACAAVADSGGSVVVPPAATPTGLRFAYIADPDGSVFGLWCPPAA
jgi:predicted enzyme related to lactoylglutathione lyase